MSKPSHLALEIPWYLKNLRKLERKYPGPHYLLIRDRRVHFASPSREAALKEGKRRFGHDFFVATVHIPRPPLHEIAI